MTASQAGAGGNTPGVGEPVVSDGTMSQGDSHVAEGPRCDPAVESDGGDDAFSGETAAADEAGDAHPDTLLAAERLEDLRRLQAEYVNYKKRVDRDRSVAREQGIQHVLESLLPVLDDVHYAREHGDLQDGPFAAIAEKLEATLGKLGVERFGAVGDEFDPQQHDALMNLPDQAPQGATTTTVVQILQPGYRMGERVVRPARVAVSDPA